MLPLLVHATFTIVGLGFGLATVLTIELDLDRITRSQTDYLALGTGRGTALANRVRRFRDVLEYGVRRFGQRQAAAAAKGSPILSDGLQSTLEAEIFGPLASRGWPRSTAAVLHGLHLPTQPLLPSISCRAGGPEWSVLDADSYLTCLDDGPPQARSFGDMTSIAVYFAPLLLMRILWIGAVGDQSQAEAELESETNGFAEWRAVNPDYANWLERACQGGGGGAP